MSIAHIITRGIGPDAAIKGIITAGILGGGGGTTPTISSVAINTAGTTFTFTFNVAVTFGAGGNAGFTATMAGGATTLTYASGSGTTALVYTSSRTITRNETGTLAYVNPGNGVVDTIGSNNLVNFSGASITNGSTVNNPPTDITLSNNSCYTTSGLNAFVGSLTTTDPDFGDTFTYSLVAGTGSTNNASYTITGANLTCNNPLTQGAGGYSVRIQTSDGVATFQKAFTVNVLTPSAGASGNRQRFGDVVGIMGVRSGTKFNG